MSHGFADLMFTPAVQALQSENGSRASYARMQAQGDGNDALSEREAGFLRAADHFYLGTVSETGWPYVQHRGGPAGFIHVLSPNRIAFADFRGNQQFVSSGNASRNNRCAMIVMDYASQTRLKMIGRLRFVRLDDLEDELFDVAELADYRARVERVAVIDVEGFDWNCPQHITPRYTVDEIRERTQPLLDRIAELEAKLAKRG